MTINPKDLKSGDKVSGMVSNAIQHAWCGHGGLVVVLNPLTVSIEPRPIAAENAVLVEHYKLQGVAIVIAINSDVAWVRWKAQSKKLSYGLIVPLSDLTHADEVTG